MQAWVNFQYNSYYVANVAVRPPSPWRPLIASPQPSAQSNLSC